MPWILGNRCRELIYTGDTFGAERAFRLGLVRVPCEDNHGHARIAMGGSI